MYLFQEFPQEDYLSHRTPNTTATPQHPQTRPSLLIALLLRLNNLPKLEPGNKVILLDKPSVDDLPLSVRVVEFDLFPHIIIIR